MSNAADQNDAVDHTDEFFDQDDDQIAANRVNADASANNQPAQAVND